VSSLFNTEFRQEVAKAFFVNFISVKDVSKRFYPWRYENIKKKGNATEIETPFREWRKSGYIEEKIILKHKKNKFGTKYTQEIEGFRLNLNPFFEIAKSKLIDVRAKEEQMWTRKLKRLQKSNRSVKIKLKHSENIFMEDRILDEWPKYKALMKSSDDIRSEKEAVNDILDWLKEKEFNSIEKEIINYIFSFKEVRKVVCKYNNLYNGILNFLERLFLYHQGSSDQSLGEVYVIGFFINNKDKYIEKVDDKEKQIEKFWDVVIDCMQKLMNKLNDISDFNTLDYMDLRFKTSISKYCGLPYDIPADETKKVKKWLLKKWSIIFEENRDLTFEESFLKFQKYSKKY